MPSFKKNREITCIGCLILIDIAAFYGALSLAFLSRKLLNVLFSGLMVFDFSLSYYFHFWWMPVTFISAIAYEKMYIKRLSFWVETKEMTKALAASVVIVFAVVSLGKLGDVISRLVIVLLGLYSLLLFPCLRFLGKKILLSTGLWKESVIIIGAGKTGTEVATGIMQEPHLGYCIVGFLDDDEGKKAVDIHVDTAAYKVLGKVSQLREFVKSLDISTVIIAVPSLSLQKTSQVTSEAQQLSKNVLLVPDLKGMALLNTELYHLFMQQLFLLKINNNLKSALNRFIKRTFDLAVSILFCPFFLIFAGVVGILVRIDSPGPLFYSHLRVGQNGKMVKVHKIRTMYIDAEEKLKEFVERNPSAREEWENFFKLKNDPRVTKIGRWLRKTSLDELPQIINVLNGSMSLVGPRPVLQEEIDNYYKDSADYYFLVKPGITGLWQASGRNIVNYDLRVKLDTWYVLNWSLWFDIVILFKTIKVVLNKEGAY
jgi:Undecaprenyl-phosphate galactose phosphotransferase WbaP